MTPPTLVADYATSFDLVTSPRTTSVTVASGNVLAVLSASEENNFQLSTPTGGSLTYNPEQSIEVASYSTVYIWSTLPGSGQTFTLSQALRSGGSAAFGTLPMRFSGSDGVGASNATNVSSGAPSLSITTTSNNSAIAVIVTDWNAGDGSSRTWRTVNSITPTNGNGYERVYYNDPTRYTIYAAYYPDAGAAGAKTVGLSAPSGQKYSIAAVEIKGTNSAPLAVAWITA